MTISSPPPPTVVLIASLSLSLLALLLLLLLVWSRRRSQEEAKEEQQQQQRFLDRIVETADGVLLSSSVMPEGGEGEEERRGRKKRGRKKKQEAGVGDEIERERERVLVAAAAVVAAAGGKNGEEDFMYPFSSSSSVTQRRIKQQYDLLVESNAAKALTMAQVGQFANCLIQARNELQHKSVIIKRKFTITKALIYKADRSTFSRLSQQICKLETEQKRLEEDALVYNRLQGQLKLSPAFKMMLELSTRMETSVDPEHTVKTIDSEFTDISFEDFLAREKKDSFWQRNGKLRSCTG